MFALEWTGYTLRHDGVNKNGILSVFNTSGFWPFDPKILGPPPCPVLPPNPKWMVIFFLTGRPMEVGSPEIRTVHFHAKHRFLGLSPCTSEAAVHFSSPSTILWWSTYPGRSEFINDKVHLLYNIVSHEVHVYYSRVSVLRFGIRSVNCHTVCTGPAEMFDLIYMGFTTSLR